MAEALLNSGYKLSPDYQTCFMQPSESENKRIIICRNFTTTTGHQVSMHNLGCRFGSFGGWWASNRPLQNLVEDYEMTNGESPFI